MTQAYTDIPPATLDPHEPTVHHESVRRRRGRGKANIGDLNLTSMIDVIFQLLIYFVVTASFMINEGILTAKLPQGEGSPADPLDLPKQDIVIGLSSGEGQTTVAIARDGNPVATFGELSATLSRLRYDPDIGQFDGTYEPDNPIVIQPNGYVRWQHVVNAFNAALAAKYTNIRFADDIAPQ